MVLTQPGHGCINFVCAATFPYHYGSYATGINLYYGGVGMTSFHTTKVLTQRKAA